MVVVTTTAELLLEWDRRRGRSQQTEIGMSEVGGCRRRAGYRLAGTPPVDPGGSVQAVMGTAIHHAVEQVFHAMQQEGLIPPEDLVEYEVRFAGVLGHLDRYETATKRLYDTKTTSGRWLEHIIAHGPDEQHVWQTHLYAASLIASGYPVREIVIDYLARDTGKDHQAIIDFNPKHVKAALDWLEQIRSQPLDMLNRDYEPDSAWCQHCPFRTPCWGDAVPDRHPRSVLFVEDPDGQKWARQLDQAREARKAADVLEKEARQALDAIRPNTSGKSDPVDVGYAKHLQWTVSQTRRLNTTAVRAEYEATGAKPPVTVSETVKLDLIQKEEGDSDE